MDINKLDAQLNSNLNSGNISTDDFLAIFTTLHNTVAGNGPGGGGGTANLTSLQQQQLRHQNNSNSALTTVANNTQLNPPLLTVDGQLKLANILNSAASQPTLTTLATGSPTPFNYYMNESLSIFNATTNFGVGLLGSSGSGTSIYPSNLTNDQYLNQSLANTTTDDNITEIQWDGRYPSGYTLTHIIIASVIVTILMIIIIVGNMLVIIAIATEKSLKNIQNWFIASLAVADFFLGLIIMPFSLANELMGYWIFGSWWCDVHSAMDVLLCTASIMNLCLISLDRYWSITKAVDYLKSRTPARAAIMITAVWIMSGLICIPPLLGWKVKMPEGPLPKCALSEDIGYVVYSALGSFYIPSCIMVFVYIRIYFAAKARARRGIKKHPRKTNNEQVTSFTTANKQQGTIPMPSSSSKAGLQQRQIATIETPPNSATLPIQIPTVTCDLASDISTSEAAEMEAPPVVYSNNHPSLAHATLTEADATQLDMETLKVSTIAATGRAGLNVPAPPSMAVAADNNESSVNNHHNGALTVNNNNGTLANNTTNNSTSNNTTLIAGDATGTGNELRVSPTVGRCRALSVGIDNDMVSEFDPSSSDSGVVSRCANVKPLKFRLCKPIFGRKSTQQRQKTEAKAAAAAGGTTPIPASKHATGKQPLSPLTHASKSDKLQQSQLELIKTELEVVTPKVQKPRDPEKEKRRIARKKEKRATLILGLIMGSFIACWLPFFFLYILVPACSSYCHIPDSAFAIAFWLGYMNSALNPAIYTIFNKDFRRAFRRILFK